MDGFYGVIVCGHCNRELNEEHGPVGSCMLGATYYDLDFFGKYGITWGVDDGASVNRSQVVLWNEDPL